MFLFLSFVLAGIVEGAAPVGAEWPLAFEFTHSLLIAILLFVWCGEHASENNISPPGGSKILAAFFPPLGIPYYTLAGFGIKEGGLMLIKAILFFVLCTASYSGLYYLLQQKVHA